MYRAPEYLNVQVESIKDLPLVGDCLPIDGIFHTILSVEHPRYRFPVNGNRALYSVKCRTNYKTVVEYVYVSSIEEYRED